MTFFLNSCWPYKNTVLHVDSNSYIYLLLHIVTYIAWLHYIVHVPNYMIPNKKFPVNIYVTMSNCHFTNSAGHQRPSLLLSKNSCQKHASKVTDVDFITISFPSIHNFIHHSNWLTQHGIWQYSTIIHQLRKIWFFFFLLHYLQWPEWDLAACNFTSYTNWKCDFSVIIYTDLTHLAVLNNFTSHNKFTYNCRKSVFSLHFSWPDTAFGSTQELHKLITEKWKVVQIFCLSWHGIWQYSITSQIITKN